MYTKYVCILSRKFSFYEGLILPINQTTGDSFSHLFMMCDYFAFQRLRGFYYYKIEKLEYPCMQQSKDRRRIKRRDAVLE